jgi:hypothetical protein
MPCTSGGLVQYPQHVDCRAWNPLHVANVWLYAYCSLIAYFIVNQTVSINYDADFKTLNNSQCGKGSRHTNNYSAKHTYLHVPQIGGQPISKFWHSVKESICCWHSSGTGSPKFSSPYKSICWGLSGEDRTKISATLCYSVPHSSRTLSCK